MSVATLWSPKAKRAIEGRRGLLHQIENQLRSEPKPRIWMHCASLGEFEQGRPILECLRLRYPNHALVLTFFSPSGYEVRKDYAGVNYVWYLPFDGPITSRRFVNALNPELALFIKYEYWYFLLQALHSRRRPILLIAAYFRANQPFFKWYGGIYRQMLSFFDYVFVQQPSALNLLATINIRHATVAGDPRFDRVTAIAAGSDDLQILAGQHQPARTLVAGSTWPDDEQLLHKWWLSARRQGWQLIIAPHEINPSHIAQLQAMFAGDCALWSQIPKPSSPGVLIIDTFGLLAQLYRHGFAAYIGGGFGRAGIHNVLEAAVYGRPCLHGPIFHQFLEATELVEAGGAFVVATAADLEMHLARWQADQITYSQAAQAAGAYVRSKAGATQIIIDYIAKAIG